MGIPTAVPQLRVWVKKHTSCYGFELTLFVVVVWKTGIPVSVEGIVIGGGPTPPSASAPFFFPS